MFLKISLIVLGVLLGSFATVALANVELPPRPTAPISAEGGLIKLVVPSNQIIEPGVTTVVQWQDGLGTWHDIEGWRGDFSGDRDVVWWVAPAQMGTTLYRWLVLDADRQTLATSDTFDMPFVSWEPRTISVNWQFP